MSEYEADAASMNVIALDTGGTTGWAIFFAGEHKAGELPADEAMDWLHGWLRDYSLDLVVVERLSIRGDSHKKSPDLLVGIEKAGVARYLCRCYGVEMIEQSPGEMQKFGLPKLRAVGWWTKGSDHARDASGHLLTALCERDPDFSRWVFDQVSA